MVTRAFTYFAPDGPISERTFNKPLLIPRSASIRILEAHSVIPVICDFRFFNSSFPVTSVSTENSSNTPVASLMESFTELRNDLNASAAVFNVILIFLPFLSVFSAYSLNTLLLSLSDFNTAFAASTPTFASPFVDSATFPLLLLIPFANPDTTYPPICANTFDGE